MTRADCRALRGAAILLARWAADIQASYFNATTRETDWEPGVKGEYEKHLRLVKRLRQIANAEQAQLFPPK